MSSTTRNDWVDVQTVLSDGRGRASKSLKDRLQHLDLPVDVAESLIAGTANLVATQALYLDEKSNLLYGQSTEFRIWPAQLKGQNAYVIRWVHARTHIFEVIAPFRIRECVNGDSPMLTLKLKKSDIVSPALKERLVFNLIWRGRESLYYRSEIYRFLSAGIEWILRTLQK